MFVCQTGDTAFTLHGEGKEEKEKTNTRTRCGEASTKLTNRQKRITVLFFFGGVKIQTVSLCSDYATLQTYCMMEIELYCAKLGIRHCKNCTQKSCIYKEWA